MPALSVIIPARNEMFLRRTVENVLENIEGDTEIIVILDGYWPEEPIQDHPRVVILHYTVPIGQRAATNIGVRLSKAKYIMKLDAHCAVDKGFDVKLMEGHEQHWVVTPRLYNLHAFDLTCKQCGHTRYQSPTNKPCESCNATDWQMDVKWQPRLNRKADFYRFDKLMHFQYWRRFEKRPEAKGDIADTMSILGACWFVNRRLWKKMGCLDENHGSWGQVGTEVACKAWLSGNRMVVNKKTWFSHMFRTQGGDFGFPYPISGEEQQRAQAYSRDLWLNDKWPLAKHKLEWLIDKFKPIPDWHEGGA